ncbi:MAG: glycosyltransferase family 2 protein [Burkholderiales bacterium]|nr:glycosyltransferase family 2 protein [Burkholderiales bacterium]
MTRDIAAVVVLFHPEVGPLLEALRAWLSEVEAVICIDNGGCSADVRAAVARLAPGRLHVIAMHCNAGVGAAHNRGIDEARRLGCSHVVLGDQDSVPRPGMVAELLRTEAQAGAAGLRVSAVGPRYIDADSGRQSWFVRCGLVSFRRIHCDDPTGWVASDFLISSGSLIRLSTLDAVGPMDEGLFIDMVDTDWFLRASHSGFVAVGACGAWMSHHLGEHKVVIRLPRLRTLPVHKPFRYYFMFRNSLVLYRRPYAPLAWIVPDVLRLAQIALFFGVLHASRRDNLRMMLRGISDGLRGTSGPGPLTERTG